MSENYNEARVKVTVDGIERSVTFTGVSDRIYLRDRTGRRSFKGKWDANRPSERGYGFERLPHDDTKQYAEHVTVDVDQLAQDLANLCSRMTTGALDDVLRLSKEYGDHPDTMDKMLSNAGYEKIAASAHQYRKAWRTIIGADSAILFKQDLQDIARALVKPREEQKALAV